jgi:cobyrinic acid a,c-diamide synthase
MTNGLMIAAPRSGSGKTTVTLGLLRAMARRGKRVAAFKCGPDYIDPAFHSVATGQPGFNLDSWTMHEALLEANMAAGMAGMEWVVAEGSMGLFDGVAMRGASGDGASADIAQRFGLPVVLVVDASGQSQSAGAVAMGFRDFNPQIAIAGVILGNVASDRHRMLAERGMERAGLRVFGALPRGGVPCLPERHLGLVQAGETPQVSAVIDALADAIERFIDVDAVMAAAGPVRSSPMAYTMVPPGRRIAIARDVAFSFAYHHLLAGWAQAGAVLMPFSPLADEAPAADADMCWLPGGYPELHAPTLSANGNFLRGLREFAMQKPVHGECGGYMVLGDALVDAAGVAWPMAGLLPLTTSFATRKLHLGYRAVRLLADMPFGKQGALVRGHEFHYASIVAQGEAEALGEASDANGASLGLTGQRKGLVTGTFFHMVAADA